MDLPHFNHLKYGSVPLTRKMHAIVVLSPTLAVVFLGRPLRKMGLDRGIAIGYKRIRIESVRHVVIFCSFVF